LAVAAIDMTTAVVGRRGCTESPIAILEKKKDHSGRWIIPLKIRREPK
jgi:hypothetical protein